MARLDIHEPTEDEQSLCNKDQPLIAEVVLSEHNLLTLLVKLYQDGSRRTLVNDHVKVEGDITDGLLLKLVSQKDEEHYDNKERGSMRGRAGEVHPITESIFHKIKSLLEKEAGPIGPSI